MPGPRVAIGERVTLRTTNRDDISFLTRQNNPDLRLPTGNPVFGQAGLEALAEEDFGDVTPFIVCLDDDGAGPGPADEADVHRIGIVTVEDHGRSRPELAYWLIPESHGEGYGSEAVGLAVDVVFQEHHHPAVEARTFPDNEPSCRLLESLGFTQEGRIRSDVYWDSQYRDQVIYGLLREEWHDHD